MSGRLRIDDSFAKGVLMEPLPHESGDMPKADVGLTIARCRWLELHDLLVVHGPLSAL